MKNPTAFGKTVLMMVVGLFVVVGLSVLPQPLYAQGFEDVVLFATNSIRLDEDTVVQSGNVVVNELRIGQKLEPGFELFIGTRGKVNDDAQAHRIKLEGTGQIKGDAECNESSEISCNGLGLPVFIEVPVFVESVVGPGAPDVAVAAHGSVTLDAGDYADITVAANGAIIFTGGVYNIGSLLALADVNLEFEAATQLRIFGMFSTGPRSFIGPDKQSSATPSNIIIYGGGSNLDPEDVNSTPAAADIGHQNKVEASFYVPNGTLRFDTALSAKGAFLARDIFVDKNGKFNLVGGFEVNPPPTADSQNVFTSDTGGQNPVVLPLDITLKGSDPDLETLTFSIVSNPSLGLLSGLPPDVIYTANQLGDFTDSFTFRVTDPAGGFDEAVVSINPLDTTTGATPTDAVVAKDDFVAAVNGTELPIFLVAFPDVANPGAVGNLSFSIVSGPTFGSVANLAPVVPALIPPPVPIPGDPVVNCALDPGDCDQPPIRSATVDFSSGTDGADSFDFQACVDLSLPPNGDTDDPGECDTATISINVDPFTPPDPPVAPFAEDIEVMTEVDTSVEIDLTSLGTNGEKAPGSPDNLGDPENPEGTHALSRAPEVFSGTHPVGSNLNVTSFSADSACAVIGDPSTFDSGPPPTGGGARVRNRRNGNRGERHHRGHSPGEHRGHVRLRTFAK